MIRSLVILGGFGRGILFDLVKAQTGFFHATIERAS